jgi:hypothetical protein
MLSVVNKPIMLSVVMLSIVRVNVVMLSSIAQLFLFQINISSGHKIEQIIDDIGKIVNKIL